MQVQPSKKTKIEVRSQKAQPIVKKDTTVAKVLPEEFSEEQR